MAITDILKQAAGAGLRSAASVIGGPVAGLFIGNPKAQKAAMSIAAPKEEYQKVSKTNVSTSVQKAREMGANSEAILAEIQKQNPAKASVIAQARKMGASADQIVDEITKQNPKQNIVDRAAATVNNAYTGYKNLPATRLARGIVGKGVEIPGLAIGGLIGGGLETANQAGRASAGKGFDLKRIVQTAKETARSTGNFGKTIGGEGAAAAPLGFAGKAANLLLAGAQGYEGQKNLRAGLKSGDAAQSFEGGLQLATSLIGARGAVKEPGLLVNRNMLEAASPGMKTARIEKNMSKAEGLIRDAYGVGKRQMQNEQKATIRAGKAGETAMPMERFLLEEGLLSSERNEGGRLIHDTTEARTKALERETQANDLLENALEKTNPSPRHNLNDLKLKAKNSVQGNSSTQRKSSQAKIEKEFDDAIEAYGELVTDAQLNKIKRGFYEQGKYETLPDSAQAYRSSGEMLAKIIEDANDGVLDVRAANRLIGQYAQAQKFLLQVHGGGVRGGGLSRKLTGLLGAIAGRATGVPVLGELLGFQIGEGLQARAVSPDRIFGKAQTIAGDQTPRSAATMSRVQGQVDAAEGARATRLALPAPKEKLPAPADTSGPFKMEPQQYNESSVRMRTLLTGKKPSAADAPIEGSKLIQNKSGQFFITRPDHVPARVSKLEALTLKRAGYKVERVSDMLSRTKSR